MVRAGCRCAMSQKDILGTCEERYWQETVMTPRGRFVWFLCIFLQGWGLPSMIQRRMLTRDCASETLQWPETFVFRRLLHVGSLWTMDVEEDDHVHDDGEEKISRVFLRFYEFHICQRQY